MTRRFRATLFGFCLALLALPACAHDSIPAPGAQPFGAALAGPKPRATETGRRLAFALEASRHKEPLPSDLAPPIAALLTPGDGVRVSIDKTTLDFWWIKELPAKATGQSVTWADVDEGTLVGAVRVSADFRDVRGRIVKPGTYTLRYGIQPQDGDHLGVSPFREFLLISPAALDTESAARGHEGSVDISKRTIGGSHPAIWSIDPPVAAASQAVASAHKTDLGHDAVVVEVPVARDGKNAGTLKFGIVLVGRIDA